MINPSFLKSPKLVISEKIFNTCIFFGIKFESNLDPSKTTY
jgi:hypothetical protein